MEEYCNQEKNGIWGRYGRYKVDLETESDLTLTLILTLTNYFRFQYTFIPAIDPIR